MSKFHLRNTCIITTLIIIFGFLNINAADSLSQLGNDLKAAIKAESGNKINETVGKIAAFNDTKAMRVLTSEINIINSNKYEAYWGVLKGFSLFTSEEALDDLADFIIGNKAKTVGRDALFILKPNHSEGMVKLLQKILDKGTREQQSLVLAHLSDVPLKIAGNTLIEFGKQPICSKDAELKKQVIASLQALLGPNAGQSFDSINKYWGDHQSDDEETLFPKKSLTARNTGTAVDHMDYVRLTRFDKLKRLDKNKIVVFHGDCPKHETTGFKGDHDFDHIEDILERMGIPHIVVNKSEIEKDDFKLDDRIAILFNCNMFRQHCICPTCKIGQKSGLRLFQCADCDKHDPYENKLSDKAIEKIKAFVEKGGYLFSEDWILEEVLERAFRGILSHTKYFPNEKNVSILPGPGVTTHPYLKGVFEKPPTESSNNNNPGEGTTSVKRNDLNVGDGKWKIDKDSPDIKIDKPKDVTVLMVSPDLDAPDKAVAVTFGYNKGEVVPPISAKATGGSSDMSGYYSGSTSVLKNKVGGQVMHVLSHFGKQLNEKDEFVLQNLLLNFLIEAADRYGYSMQNKK